MDAKNMVFGFRDLVGKLLRPSGETGKRLIADKGNKEILRWVDLPSFTGHGEAPRTMIPNAVKVAQQLEDIKECFPEITHATGEDERRILDLCKAHNVALTAVIASLVPIGAPVMEEKVAKSVEAAQAVLAYMFLYGYAEGVRRSNGEIKGE